MIVDTSALVAITFAEPGHGELIAKLAAAPSAGSALLPSLKPGWYWHPAWAVTRATSSFGCSTNSVSSRSRSAIATGERLLMRSCGSVGAVTRPTQFR